LVSTRFNKWEIQVFLFRCTFVSGQLCLLLSRVRSFGTPAFFNSLIASVEDHFLAHCSYDAEETQFVFINQYFMLKEQFSPSIQFSLAIIYKEKIKALAQMFWNRCCTFSSFDIEIQVRIFGYNSNIDSNH